ncbi:unnamed protein product [Schistocephalus solidus]|uniref:KH domain-containing protein n=1 Tax=Schistocephalus solidus TaxID=70667 RepID=A0A183THR2_SCHSO|nr:unnamed protein product [Schistocephalus solidus]
MPLPAFEPVVEHEQVRPQNTQKTMSVSDFHTCILEVPKELENLFQEQQNLLHIVRTCGPSMLVCKVTPEIQLPNGCQVNLEDETKAYFLVICTSAEGIFKAQTLGPEIARMLRQKFAILHQIDELNRKLKENQAGKNDSFFHEEFPVSPDLIGQSIGARGANIRRARALDGVVSVVLRPETCTFKVVGKTKEAVESAKKVLEYATEIMQVPQEYVSRIIGQKNRHIQALVDRIGLARIRVQSAEEATVPNCVPFAFTGTRSAINDAKLLINFNIENLKEIDRLQQSLTANHLANGRFGEGDGHFRRERSSKSHSDGTSIPWGNRYHGQADYRDGTTSNGDGQQTSEGEHCDGPAHYRPSYRRNTQQPRGPNRVADGNRQVSLPPPVPKSGLSGYLGLTSLKSSRQSCVAQSRPAANAQNNYHSGTEMTESQRAGRPISHGGGQRRNGRRPANDRCSENSGDPSTSPSTGNRREKGTNGPVAKRIGRVPVDATT